MKNKINHEKFKILNSHDLESTMNSIKVCRFFYECAFKERNLKKIEEAKIGYESFKTKALKYGAEPFNLLKELNYLEIQN